MKRIALPRKAADLTGQVFGHLHALHPVQAGPRRNRSVLWRCRCACGGIAVVSCQSLRQGTTVSCGCSKSKKSAGQILASVTHGLSDSREWRAWRKMKARCYDKKHRQFKDWGGRGIKVCKRWRDSFEAFLADVGRCPADKYSLDRYPNNDGDYELGNVRWATRSEQMRNKRTNRIVRAFGREAPLVCFFPGGSKSLAYRNARQRIVRYGWKPERAISASMMVP